MVTTNTGFEAQRAPCGRVVGGEIYRDRDDETVLTQELDYACGCRTIRHEYHDGSISQKAIRHDGTVLVDELLSAE
jgi:membrane-bound inhibitor of C-type lysozyme